MSSKHRHGLPKKRPANTKHEAIADEIPTLEPVVGGETAADGPVKVACEPAGEAGFDALLTVTVPDMDKKATAGVVEPALRTAAVAHAAELRWRRVVVKFAGEAMIGTAVKDAVKDWLAAAKTAQLVVRRGYGDERVHEVTPPALAVDTKVKGSEIAVTIGTAGVDAEDFPVLFGRVLADVAAKANAHKVTLQFDGGHKPDAALRERIGATLQAAGAVRAAIGARVLFDRELLDRCKVGSDGDAMRVILDPAADPATTGEAMELVLPEHALELAGKIVRVHWKSGPAHGEGDHLLRILAKFAPERVEFARVGGEAEVVWPALLEVVAGAETVVRVRANGRSHSAVLAAFPRECRQLGEALRGKAVVVDWPALFVVDADSERVLLGAMREAGASRVACTVAGDAREPFAPPVAHLDDTGSTAMLKVDTDLGRPAELLRALERQLPRRGGRAAGRPVRIVFAGAAPATRTLQRALLDAVAGAGPTRLELEDHGPVDVFLPPMLDVKRRGAAEVHLAIDVSGRDEVQRTTALRRELEAAALPKGAIVTITPSAMDAEITAALVALGADSVTRSDGEQLYPELLPEPEPEPVPAPAPAAAAPTPPVPEVVVAAAAAPASPSATPLTGIRVLARNDEAVPPTVMLGIDAGDEPVHIAAIERELAAHLPRLQRRCAMVVLQRGGEDVPVRRTDAMVAMLQRVLPQGPAASMVFRGPDAQGRPHFQVVHSTLRALPVGATFLDPRRPR
ncbi:MAG: hypothetical protein U1E73_04855 [Planctomycetota bacterium]